MEKGSSRQLMELARMGMISGVQPRAVRPGQLIVPPSARKKVGRNEPCPCGSGKKFKKCCIAKTRPQVRRTRPANKIAREKPVVAISGADVQEVAEHTEAPAPKQQTAQAMLRAGVSERIVWAYLETGLYITEANKAAQPPERLAKWEAAIKAYEKATPEERQILAVPDSD